MGEIMKHNLLVRILIIQISEYPTFEATVVKVTDGDTLTISHDNKEEKVRLLLVDTPESVKPGVDPQPFSLEASNYVKGLLDEGKEIIAFVV